MDFLGSLAARRPLADYPKASAKALLFKLSPELGTTMDPGRPLIVEPRQICFERAFADTKDVAPLTAKNLADQAPAKPGGSNDLLDRCPHFDSSRIAALVSSRRR